MAKVVLWTAPRSLSTAFERSIRELNGVKVFHEPHKSIIAIDESRTLEEVQSAFFGAAQDAIFIKDQCYHIAGCFEEALFSGPLHNFKHTFIIRHPAKAAMSHYKNNLKALRPYTDNKATSHQPTYAVYHLVKGTLDPSPIVIDADDLLCDPKGIMHKYCEATGLPFRENMVTWTPRSFPDWENCRECNIWHSDVIKSSGFVQRECPSSPPALTDLPEEFRAVVEESLPYYESLHSMRLQ